MQSKRRDEPNGGDPVGPRIGDLTLYTLRQEHEHRGATWFDSNCNVVWLCAYGLHRSGDPDDAFQDFASLREAGRIYPSDDDRIALDDDRRRRFIDLVPPQAANARRDAIGRPGTILERSLGHPSARLVNVRVHADVVETIAEISFALEIASLSQRSTQSDILFLQNCFALDGEECELTTHLGVEPVQRGEIGFRLLTEAVRI